MFQLILLNTNNKLSSNRPNYRLQVYTFVLVCWQASAMLFLFLFSYFTDNSRKRCSTFHGHFDVETNHSRNYSNLLKNSCIIPWLAFLILMRFSHIKSHWIDRFKMEIKAIKFDHGKKKKKKQRSWLCKFNRGKIIWFKLKMVIVSIEFWISHLTHKHFIRFVGMKPRSQNAFKTKILHVKSHK